MSSSRMKLPQLKPGYSLMTAALLWFFLGCGGFFSAPFSLLWFFTGIILLPFIIADALFLLLLTDRLRVGREMPSSLSLGEKVKITLTLEPRGKGMLPGKLRVFDLYPPSFNCAAFPALFDLRALRERGRAEFEYTAEARERGEWEFLGTELMISSPLHFWRLKSFSGAKSSGRTYPDFRRMLSLAGTEIRGLLDNTGLKEIRRRGQGLEYRELREYQPGDPIKTIDWRATARRRKLISREYQEERDQQLLFLLDSGYRLHRREGELLQFDSALNGAILLSYVALKHGDSVAAASFGAEERWIGPRKGMRALTGLMNQLYDLKSGPAPSSPFLALENALARLHRRTFIILISNLREEDGESLSWILPRIRGKHLLLALSLREGEAETLARRHSSVPEEELESAAAFSYLFSRKQLYRSWEHSGLLTLESSAAELSPALINSYLSLKKSGLL